MGIIMYCCFLCKRKLRDIFSRDTYGSLSVAVCHKCAIELVSTKVNEELARHRRVAHCAYYYPDLVY